HWQSQSWWRVFNDHEYGKLHPYFTMNLAAIFTNEDAGWNVMAYVKNVTDETAITGAFLLSDDTALVTNVFLTEPRLYGLRVTKAWSGGSLLGGFGALREGPYPLTVEIGGQVQRHDAPNEFLTPGFADEFSSGIDPRPNQDNDLDWGDGREIKLTYQAQSGWNASASVRYGKTNGASRWSTLEEEGDRVCPTALFLLGQNTSTIWCETGVNDWSIHNNYTTADTVEREEHTLVDFLVGREVTFGGLDESTVSGGLRYAGLESTTAFHMFGRTHWNIPAEAGDVFKYTGPGATFDRYEATDSASREFNGAGPVLSWEASKTLLGAPGKGLRLDWTLSGGVLFGDRETTVERGEETVDHWLVSFDRLTAHQMPHDPVTTDATPAERFTRSESVTVPTYGASLGLSYKIGGFKIGTGYRWERYDGAIDGGFMEAEDADRTIDGPYFKLSVGFGG
ncbi:MAG TPA: Lpg1974 family pore-forming outer membrane protein, partial [Caulobacteraceae bacterium]|nr:Lpg1974 family pore-forming outer membrane protein [Caulobacteraceae bacterium]